MRRILPILLVNSVGLVLAVAPAHAQAIELVCDLSEKDLISVDGLLDDWQGFKKMVTRGENARDATLTVRCTYDEAALYIAVEATDDQLIRRGKKDKGAEDQVSLAFGKDRLELWPGLPDAGIAVKAKWKSGGSVKAIAVADSLQPKGWSIEVGIPRGKVPGLKKGVTSVPLEIVWQDADLFSESKHQESLTTGKGGVLTLQEGAALYQQFLEDLRINPKDIWLDQMANMDGEPGDERVIVAGRIVGILSDSYAYVQLPVPRKEIKSLQLIDLAGEGKSAILVHYVERGNGGSREVIAVWNFMPDGSFVRPFAHEVAKESPEGRMTNTWTLVAKGAPVGKKGKKTKGKGKKGKGHDIIIEPGELRGFSEATWNETPAADMAPILLPWGEVKRERWRFEGDECSGGPE